MRAILTGIFKCSRCGLQNQAGSTHCAACGFDLSNQGVPNNGSTPNPTSPAPITQRMSTPSYAAAAVAPAQQKASIPLPAPSAGSTPNWLGHRKLDGTVIHVAPSHLIPRPRRWGRALAGLAVSLCCFGLVGIAAQQAASSAFATVISYSPLILVLLVAFFAIRGVFRRMFGSTPGGNSGGGFLKTIFAGFVGAFLTTRILGQRPTIPVCDYRVRDTSGNEHLVRVEGYVKSGGMAVGDDVLIEGVDRGGTIVLKRGFNKRLHTSITVTI